MRRRRLKTRSKVMNTGRRLSIIPLILSAIFLITGTYAWFTYFSDIDITMSGHVVNWSIEFKEDNTNVTEHHIVIDMIYPGMDDYIDDLTIVNNGETKAKITYEITKARILSDEYVVGENFTNPALVEKYGAAITSDVLKTLLSEYYPFQLTFGLRANQTTTTLADTGYINAGQNEAYFSSMLVWDFEHYKQVASYDEFDATKTYYDKVGSNYVEHVFTDFTDSIVSGVIDAGLYYADEEKDAADTAVGKRAAEYKQVNAESPSIELFYTIHAEESLE